MAQQFQHSLGAFDPSLTSKDEQNLKAFRTLLKMDNIEVFSSDDFRRYGLDRFIRDTQHGIGTFFAKLSKNGLVEHVGYKASDLASNHGHTIKTYKWRVNCK
jgi:hypothetical protein